MSTQLKDNDLRRRQPYVFGWGTLMGSLIEYSWMEATKALEDGAPEDATYCREFSGITQQERDNALAEEREGVAFVVCDADGNPIRVWYTIRGCQNEDTTSLVRLYAENWKTCGRPRNN